MEKNAICAGSPRSFLVYDTGFVRLLICHQLWLVTFTGTWMLILIVCVCTAFRHSGALASCQKIPLPAECFSFNEKSQKK